MSNKPHFECPRCEYGYVRYMTSDGYIVSDACYHCNNTGWVIGNPWLEDELGCDPSVDSINRLLQEISNE